MIQNERQYKITSKLAAEFEATLAILPDNAEFNALPGLMQKAYVSSVKRQLRQFHDEIREYDLLKAGKFDFDKLPSIEEISSWLINARIARGLRQEDLAKLLKLKKQQVQQYEASDYSSASLHRLREVLAALQSYDPLRRAKMLIRRVG